MVSPIVSIQSLNHYQQLLLEGKTRDVSSLLILLCYTDWIEMCQHLREVFNELHKKYTNVTSAYRPCIFAELQADHINDVSLSLGVHAVPLTLVIECDTGHILDRISGASSQELVQKLASLMTPIHSTVKKEDEKQKITELCRQLTHRSPVIIFIKGTPREPRCGFTQQIIEILNHYPSLKYDSFDILQDESVRQGLKEYSHWPTYPQVYVNGQLIGGLDIVKELHQQGELEALWMGS
jgi:Grx4 family monothiol glutaredoxin